MNFETTWQEQGRRTWRAQLLFIFCIVEREYLRRSQRYKLIIKHQTKKRLPQSFLLDGVSGCERKIAPTCLNQCKLHSLKSPKRKFAPGYITRGKNFPAVDF